MRPKVPKGYSRPIPGDRVQADVCKVGPGVYQNTAVDDCSRFIVIGMYPRRTARNTVDFLERVFEEMPFPVQRIQTDRGQEFFAYLVQDQLRAWRVKFRPIRPRSPHLNGKVERAQRTTLEVVYRRSDGRRPPGPTRRVAALLQLAAPARGPGRSIPDRPRLRVAPPDPAQRSRVGSLRPGPRADPHSGSPVGRYRRAHATMSPDPTARPRRSAAHSHNMLGKRTQRDKPPAS